MEAPVSSKCNRSELHKRQRYSSRIVGPLILVIDLVCLLASIPLTLVVYSATFDQHLDPGVHVSAALISTVAFLLIRISHDSYGHSKGRFDDADRGVVVDYMIAALLTVAMIWQLGLGELFSRGVLALYAALTVVSLFLSRFLLRSFVKRLSAAGHIAQRVALLGADPELAKRAYQLLELERLPHLKIIGMADDRSTRIQREGLQGLPYLGGLGELLQLARAGQLDQVLIAMVDIRQDRLDDIVDRLSAVSVDVSLIPREALVLSTSYKVSFIGSAPVLTVWERPVRDANVLIKNAEDKVLALLGLILVAPILLITAVAIKLTSRGPVFFTQKRFGFNNSEISVIKFRSMHVDLQDKTGAARTTRQDPRVTSVGRIIRRLSIDELPQLLNVLKGDMSIVGPRPHATMMKVGDQYYFDAVRGYASRHRVKPGITGLAQVRGLRGEIDSIEKAKRRVDYDRYYIDNWSLLLDLRIVAETVFKVVADRQAY